VKQCAEKRPESWRNDNAPAHKAPSVRQFVPQNLVSEMKHPPYSPDLAPHDFWLFPEIKSTFKRRRFQDIEDIKTR
jgi:hypothetical protein